MPKTKQSSSRRVVNNGVEIYSEEHKTIDWGSEPNFIKLYLKDALYLADLPNQHYKLLYKLLNMSTYSGDKYGMHVCLSSGIKRILSKELGLKNNRSINNSLSALVKGHILYRIDTGVYSFNPYLFGKGDWQDVSKLRLEIEYSEIEGKTFKTVFGYKNSED